MSENVTTIENAATSAERDEALIAFLDAGSSADLNVWAQRHPASAADFARAAAARWAGAPVGVAETSAGYTVGTERIRSVGREALQAFRATRVPAVAPLSSLIVAAKECGLDAASLAARVRVPYALFVKLHRHLIAPDSIPATVVAEMADALGRRRDEVAAYFRLSPMMAPGASYRADAAPTVGEQIAFADALDADPNTTAEHRAFHATPGDAA